MSIFVTAGSHIYVGGPMARKRTPHELSDFAAQSWTEVAWWENAGEFGDESQSVTADYIAEKRTQKFKGTRNAGDPAMVFGLDYEDAGQAILKVAETLPSNYAFKIVFDDAPEGGTPSERYFIGLVMSAREALDQANNVAKLNVTIGLNSNTVRVDAAA